MALSAVAKTKRDGLITLKDGTAVTPISLDVQYEDGDMSFEGISAHQADLVAFFDRGEFYSVRKANHKFVTFKFTAHFTELSDATNSNLFDFATFNNKFSTNVSTNGANGEVKTVDILWTVEGTTHGDTTDHTMLATKCALEISVSEGEPNKFAISGTCYGTVTAT